MSEPENDDPTGGAAAASGASEATAVEAVPETPEQQIEALKRECSELRDQLLRRRADFDNFKKRVERDRQQASVEASASIYRGLIPTLDNLERALQAEASDQSIREGVELVRRDLASLLESSGVVAEDPTGTRFDPERHQALSHEPAPGVSEGTVVETYRKGYSYKDRLLRPALVKVAAGAEDGTGGSEPGAVH